VRVKQFARRFSRINGQRDWPGRDLSFDDNKLKVEKKGSGDSEQRQLQFSIHLFRTS
jgi:hypothetical protein